MSHEKKKKGQTYSRVTTFSAGRFSVNKFLIFLIFSRDTRSAPSLLFSFVDDDVHSRKTANIRWFCCAAETKISKKKLFFLKRKNNDEEEQL